MRVAFFGDVVGKAGREALLSYIEAERKCQRFDCVIVNGENAAHGFGINEKICNQFFKAGIDAITLGNHSFDQKSDLSIHEKEKRLIRPLNYPKRTPGRGYTIVNIPFSSKNILVINLIGRVFMELNDDPFIVLDDLLKTYILGKNIDAIFVDIHAEATAEKMALARYFDGRVTAMVGTHTHVPTADLQISKKGTLFLSDVGMCGDYNSIIGMEEEGALKRFVSKIDSFARMTPATDKATVCGVVFDTGSDGVCEHAYLIRHGGFLIEQSN